MHQEAQAAAHGRAVRASAEGVGDKDRYAVHISQTPVRLVDDDGLIALAERRGAELKPMFADLGLSLDSFVVENLSLPDELQKLLDTRIGMNMLGDMGKYTQYQVAQSLPIAAANEGGIAGNLRTVGAKSRCSDRSPA